jgi:leucyl aminopeptidase
MVRKLATAGALAARQRRVPRAAFAVRGDGIAADLAQAVAEGLTLAEFHAGSYKTDDTPPAAVRSWTVVASDDVDGARAMAEIAVSRGRILGECSNLARELSNEPGNVLPPREFARAPLHWRAKSASRPRFSTRSRSKNWAWAFSWVWRAEARSRRA